MKQSLFKLKTQMLALFAGTAFLFSCNKDLPEAVPTPYVPPAAPSIYTLISSANFSILKAAVDRAGFQSLLRDSMQVYTVFAPDDAAFQASGIPNPGAIAGIPVATLQSILSYHLIGGERYNATRISDKYPNMYLQSALLLQAPSASLPPGYRMPLGISRRGSSAWANQIPVKQADVQASNGIVHVIAALLSPPQQVLAQIVAGDPSYSYLLAAVQRADQGPPPGAPALLPILSNAAANLTVFAPTNTAFNNLFAALGLPQDMSTFALLPSATVWGIVAFHVQGVRAFSPNLDNTSRPSVMGVNQQFNVTTSAVQVRGPGNVVPTPGGPVNFFANVTSANINAVNGVIHRVDAVLLPQ
ncbi:MAG: fasciclin domain-containing protein [Chitinophagaceae bacterium]|nr:fasciclin domain-containing protein [Chitinophagaceae bacterium]